MSGISFQTPQAVRFAARRWRPSRRSLALTIAAPVVALTTATLPAAASAAAPATAVPATATALGALAAPGAVPAPPSGWSTVFSDDFNGAAGSGAGSQWI